MLSVFNVSAQWSDQTSGITNDLNSVYFTDADNGWAVGRQGKVIHTTNGGATWTVQNSGTTKDLEQIQMINNTVGYAVGDGGTFIKYDGSNWTTRTLLSTLDYSALYFMDENNGYIGSDWCHIDLTSDGGSSWVNKVNNSSYVNKVNGFGTSDGSDIWAVGSGGFVLKNDGSGWIKVTIPGTSSTDFLSIHFKDGDGWITGKNNTIVHYDGSSWNMQSSPISDGSASVTDAIFDSKTSGYAVVNPSLGGTGRILKYNSGSWTTDYTYSGIGTELFYGVHTAGGSTYVVGAGGLVKKAGGGGSNVAVPAVKGANKTMDLEAYPNSFGNTVHLKFNLLQEQAVNISVTNTLGEEVMHLTKTDTKQGKNTIDCNTVNLAAGMYFITVVSQNQKETIKAIKQ